MRGNNSLATSENELSSKVPHSSSGKYDGLWCVTSNLQNLFLTPTIIDIS